MSSLVKQSLNKTTEYGHYKLQDGSMVYKSLLFDGKYFVWQMKQSGYTATTAKKQLSSNSSSTSASKSQTTSYPDGDVLLDKTGIKYFDTPEDAIKYVNKLNKSSV